MSRKLKYPENHYRNFIYKNTTEASRYEQVAEEAVELAHIAQKIARILRGEQPVAKDVTFGGGHYDVDKKFLDIYDTKLLRWCERIEEKIGKTIEEYEQEEREALFGKETEEDGQSC